MATVQSVKSKLQGLIDKSNATTGNSDKDLTSAVDALVSGYGVGNIPIEVSTAEDMDKILALATSADIGKAYIYTGESTEKYEKGAFYVITRTE